MSARPGRGARDINGGKVRAGKRGEIEIGVDIGAKEPRGVRSLSAMDAMLEPEMFSGGCTGQGQKIGNQAQRAPEFKVDHGILLRVASCSVADSQEE
jgi:hypothetical protein